MEDLTDKTIGIINEEIKQQNKLIEERQQEINSLHGSIIELNELMKILNSSVQEQGDQVDNIQSTIELANNNVKKATDEIKKAEKYF
jgi:syntaxin 7